MTALASFVAMVERLADWLGRAVSVLIFAMIFVLLYGVVMRYVVGRPTVWAGELSGMIYAVYFLIGGVYALRWRAHINVEILYSRLGLRARAALDLLTWILFYLFLGVLFWLGIDFAWTSIQRMEVSNTVWAPYIWPIKLFLPISAFLMLLLGLAKTLSDVVILITGRPLRPEEPERSILSATGH